MNPDRAKAITEYQEGGLAVDNIKKLKKPKTVEEPSRIETRLEWSVTYIANAKVDGYKHRQVVNVNDICVPDGFPAEKGTPTNFFNNNQNFNIAKVVAKPFSLLFDVPQSFVNEIKSVKGPPQVRNDEARGRFCDSFNIAFPEAAGKNFFSVNFGLGLFKPKPRMSIKFALNADFLAYREMSTFTGESTHGKCPAGARSRARRPTSYALLS